MRILMIHNRYLQRGGEDQSFEARVRLLSARGHVVDCFVEDNHRIAELGGVRSAQRAVWSREAYRRVLTLLQANAYALVDVHNTFPLISPAVYYAARSQRIPVVQTLHNYRLLCPKATFFRDGRVCEDCLGKAIPWPGAAHGCYRASHLGSLAVVAMLSAHRLAGTWTNAVDTYIAISEFARTKFVEGGLPADKIVVARHFVEPDPGEGQHAGDYALFVGRLAPEKGVATLLAAWERLAGRIRLRIAGDGPLAATVAEAAERMSNVEFMGAQSQAQVRDLMGDARLLVLPSEWYEPFGLVAIEAYARGLPVIASQTGALTEIVAHGQTGLHVPPGRPEELADAVGWAWSQGHTEVVRMGRAARLSYEARYTAGHAYADLMLAYEHARATA